MPDIRSRIVVEAHALRSATAVAALLHGSRRSPRELPRPLARLIGSIVVGVVLLLAIWAATKIGTLLAARD